MLDTQKLMQAMISNQQRPLSGQYQMMLKRRRIATMLKKMINNAEMLDAMRRAKIRRIASE